MKDRTQIEIDEIVRNGTTIPEMILADHNAQNPIIVTPEMKEKGIENLEKIVKSKITKQWVKKLNKFFTKYPNYKKQLENHDNYKNLLILFPKIKKGLNHLNK